MKLTKKNWHLVRKGHVLKAIRMLDTEEHTASKARNTYLVYKGKLYPAKHIRGLAYKNATGESLRNDEYSGGSETALFLGRLGFTVQYKERKNEPKLSVSTDKKYLRQARLSVVKQKNALQRLLQKKLGVIETEKKYAWLKTPNKDNLPAEYKSIYEALIKSCGSDKFIKSNYPLSCDFCLEDRRHIFEYDERQHFSSARKLTLENYSQDVRLGFPKDEWIQSCEQIGAKDQYPPLRDQGRALFDAVRDIEAWRNDYKLIRIRHGEFDWEGADAEKHLKLILARARRSKKMVEKTRKAHSPRKHVLDKSPGDIDFRSLELEFQRIRLNFLKWLFFFQPPEKEVFPGSGYGDNFRLIQSLKGRSFSLFPCGSGSVYAGGGRGNVDLPPTCFKGPAELEDETQAIKRSLQEKVKTLRIALKWLLHNGQTEEFWATLQNYYWLKLGLHEYVFDAKFYNDRNRDALSKEDVRGYIVKAMQYPIDLGQITPSVFDDNKLRKSIQFKITWNKYALCSFDCGPIAWGREGFVPFSDVVKQRLSWNSEHKSTFNELFSDNDKDKKREYAIASFGKTHHFEALYHQAPLVNAARYSGFKENRTAIRRVLESGQEKINGLIEKERLPLRPFYFLPK